MRVSVKTPKKRTPYIFKLNCSNPVRFLISRVLWRTRLCQFTTIDRGLYRLRFFPTGLSAGLWSDPTILRKEEKFFRCYLRKGDVVLDIGANIGTASLTAAAIVGDSGSVFSVEPHPVTFQYLQRNIAINGFKNIHTFNLAAGDSNGVVPFSNKNLDDTNQVLPESKLLVRVQKLDDLLLPLGLPSVEVLKIDVEGFEKYVLQGALEMLSRVKCILFESVERNFASYGYSSSEVSTLLRHRGFGIYKVKRFGGANRFAIKDLPRFLQRAGNVEIVELK